MMTNLKEWRKRRERKAKKPAAKVVRMEPETLLERLLRYARMKGLEFIKKPHKVDCLMPSGALLTIYHEPSRIMGGTKPFLLYGEVFYPYRKYGRYLYLNERTAKFLYVRLAKAIDEL